MADVLSAVALAGSPVGATPDTAREVAELTNLLTEAIAGAGPGQRGPSTDARVLARRLAESGRVRVDLPGRLSTDEVVELALRCGRAETALREERLRRDVVEASYDRLRAELVAEQDEAFRIRQILVRACTNGGGRYLLEAGIR